MIALGTAAALLGQTAPQAAATRQPATLHQAWLTEVMDLDVPRAIELYVEVTRDRQPENHERWLAVGRLLELHRLGLTGAPALDPLEVPNALRGPFASARTPADPARLEAHARALLGGSSLLSTPLAPPSAQTEAPRLPVLRPIVHDAETWLLGLSGLSWRDRLRQRQPPSFDRTLFTDRYNAMRVVAAELDGRRSQADEVRALYFTQWRPPALDGEPAAVLEQVRRNLAAMQQERSPASALLPRLGEALDKAAAQDPQQALQLVQRLPLFAELLLASDGAAGPGGASDRLGTERRSEPAGGSLTNPGGGEAPSGSRGR